MKDMPEAKTAKGAIGYLTGTDDEPDQDERSLDDTTVAAAVTKLIDQFGADAVRAEVMKQTGGGNDAAAGDSMLD